MNLDRLFEEAVTLGLLPVIKQLVRSGASIGEGDVCLLRWAVRYHDLEIVKYLISIGANVRSDDDHAFRVAASNGHTAVVDYLKKEIEKLENSAKVL